MKKQLVFKNVEDYFDKMSRELRVFKDIAGQSFCYKVSEEFGEGSIERVILRNGIEIIIKDMELTQNLEFSYKMEKNSFEIVYCVEGCVAFGDLENQNQVVLNNGDMYFWINECAEGWMRLPCECRWYGVSICFEGSFIESFLKIPGVMLDMATFMKIIKENDTVETRNIKLPDLELVFNQILNCSYRDISKIVYLESKAIEIISILMEKQLLAKQTERSRINLTEEDRKKLYTVKEIIIENMLEPLSITELSRKIGMNTYKLKSGFKEIYGTTIFSYLRDMRMEKARQLLADETKSVLEVANEVGYSNPSHFSAAFKRKYGVNPSALRIRA